MIRAKKIKRKKSIVLSGLSNKWKSIPIQAKASVSYAVCSILQKSLSFFTLPLFTRLMSVEQYGQYSIYTSWSSILTIFITLNLAYGSFSTAMVKFEDDRPRYIAAIQNIVLMLSVVFLAIYLPFADAWNTLFELPTALVCLMVAEIVTHFSLMCWYGIKRFEFKYISVILLTLATAVAAPATAYFMVIGSEEKGYARIFGYALVSIAVGAALFVSNAVKGKGGFSKRYIRYALGFNIPLITYYLSQVVFNQSDRIMISHISGTDKAGMYNVAYSLATLLTFVLNAINNSYVPWFYGKIKQGKEAENRNVANGIALLMAFLLLGIIALAPEIIYVMAGEAYAQATWVVPPVAMSILLLFYSQLFINVEFYFEEKTLLIWGSVGSALLNVVLNAWLIPLFGFVAAGYTTLVSYVVFAVANYFTMRLILKKKGFKQEAFDLKSLILLFLLFTVLSFAAMALYSLPWIRYGIVAAVLLAAAILHKRVFAFVKGVLSKG